MGQIQNAMTGLAASIPAAVISGTYAGEKLDKVIEDKAQKAHELAQAEQAESKAKADIDNANNIIDYTKNDPDNIYAEIRQHAIKDLKAAMDARNAATTQREFLEQHTAKKDIIDKLFAERIKAEKEWLGHRDSTGTYTSADDDDIVEGIKKELLTSKLDVDKDDKQMEEDKDGKQATESK